MLSHQPSASAPLTDARLHPRRCTARDSVSLPRKRKRLSHESEDRSSVSRKTNAPQPSPHCSLQKKPSPESDGNLSASQWFANANSNIDGRLQHQSGYDNEPPFFISQNALSDCFDTIEHDVADAKPFGGYNSRQDSEKEDLRDVIDDLTIENKRLKQLLKKRKGQHDSQGRDKLFEVRVHGLPSDKKRELEELLRNFASNLNINSDLPSGLLSGLPSGAPKPHDGTVPLGQTDSGYVSNSNSGQASATPSNPRRPTTAASRKSNDKTVKSYLHNIPKGLLPRQPLVMSERAKMSLVVRRLENLFTGKKAAPGEHSQPLQQQEVSRLAANADMQHLTESRRQEGSREAHILPPDSQFIIERLDLLESSSSEGQSRLTATSEGSGKSTPEGMNSTSSAGRSPDQRPTRPLDLDVHRAQVAEENIEYIRHLGLKSPKLNSETDKEDGDGWIYLNLLISMAQLHTVNVTPGFIRKSIKKLSAKFELSEDGNKVRWKGGNEATQFRSGTVQDSDVGDGNSAIDIGGLGTHNPDQQSDGKTSSNAQTSATPSEDHSSKQPTSQPSMWVQPFSIEPEFTTTTPLSRSQPASSVDYKPILLTGKSLSRPNRACLNGFSAPQWHIDNSSAADSNETPDGTVDHADAGPIVFYNSTLFCSDFSGDWAPTNMRQPNWEVSKRVLGVRSAADLDETRDRDVSYFAKSAIKPVTEPTGEAITFDLASVVDSRNAEQKLRELPASGIGGVTLQDNFLIDVKIARTPWTARDGNGAGVGKREQQNFTYRVATCSKTDLPPSQLPPPSYIFLPFTSSSSSAVDEAWDSEDEAADTSIDEHEPVPPIYLAQFSAEDSSPIDGDEEMDTDSSIDMLTSGRAVDLTLPAAGERESDLASQVTSVDEEVVATSLAATAGNCSDTDSGVESDVDEPSSYTDSDDDL